MDFNLMTETSLFLIDNIDFIVGGVGIILSIYFYFRSIRTRNPKFTVKNTSIIARNVEKFDGLHVQYNDNKVDSLSVARVAIWNDGAEAVRYEDVPKLDTFRVKTLNDSSMLSARIIFQKTAANNFHLAPIPDPNNSGKHLKNELDIIFEYFDYGEGVVLEVLHTGSSSNDITVSGRVIGGMVQRLNEPLFRLLPELFSPLKNISYRGKKTITGIALFISPIFVVFGEILSSSNDLGESLGLKSATLIFLFIIYWTLAISVFRRRLPVGFEILEEEVT